MCVFFHIASVLRHMAPVDYTSLFFVVQLVHPSLNRHFLSDTAWTLSMYLESLAIVPQLYMFQKQAKGIVEVLVRIFYC